MAALSERLVGRRWSAQSLGGALAIMLGLALLALVWRWPGDELALRSVTFPRPGMIVVDVTNRSREPLRVSQVLVDGAFWQFAITPDATLRPGARATLRIPYPWIADEPHRIALLTDRGVSYERVVAAGQRPSAWQNPAIPALLAIGGVAGTWRLLKQNKDSR